MQNGELTFAKQMISNALREIEKGDSVHEGLFNACTESLRWVDPSNDLSSETREAFEQLTQAMGCSFDSYDRESVSRAVSAKDEFSALRIADEIWCLWVLLGGEPAPGSKSTIPIVNDTALK